MYFYLFFSVQHEVLKFSKCLTRSGGIIHIIHTLYTHFTMKKCISILTRGYQDFTKYELLLQRNQHIERHLDDKTIFPFFMKGIFGRIIRWKLGNIRPR